MSFVIDYFSVLGRKLGPLIPNAVNMTSEDGSGQQIGVHPRDLWESAITDIGIQFDDEELPDTTWEILETTVDGERLRPPFIIYRRRKHSKRLDHIVKISLVQPEDILPFGYEIVGESIGRLHTGYLRPLGFLALKRADISSSSYCIFGFSMIRSLCIAAEEEEELIEGFIPITRVEHSSSLNLAAEEQMCPVKLGYNASPSIGVCDLTYQYATLDRYPREDYKGCELPVNELPMFCFPQGLSLKFESGSQFPLPSFFTFVFTDIKGDHLYAACLRFHESLSSSDAQILLEEIHGVDTKLRIPNGHTLFSPKVICVITRKPYYRAMRRLLRQIYSMSLSALRTPIEYFISMLCCQLPHPVEGGRPFHLILDGALISASSRGLAPIIFDQPVARFFPHMDLDFAGSLRCLSVENMLTVFTLLLREAKIVFLCSSNNLLTEVMETFRSLLFPLSWSSTFISRLPDALVGVLEAPGGFMIGFHETASTKRDMADIANFSWGQSLTAGTYVVNLTNNTISQFDGSAIQLIPSTKLRTILKILPPGPKKRLENKLNKIAIDFKIGPQRVADIEQKFDSAFDFQTIDEDAVDESKWAKFPTLEIRDIFLSFMIDLIGSYWGYIIRPTRDMCIDTFRTFKESFDVTGYLVDADATAHTVLELLLETQMFAVLLQQRSEGDAYSLVFFERASTLLRDLGLSLGGHGGKFYPISAVTDLPAPIYKLLAADERWSLLNGRKTEANTLVILDKHGNHVGTIPSSTLTTSPARSNGGMNLATGAMMPSSVTGSTHTTSSATAKASSMVASVASSLFRTSPQPAVLSTSSTVSLNVNSHDHQMSISNNSNISPSKHIEFTKIQKDYLKTLLAYIQHFEGFGSKVEMEYVSEMDGLDANVPRDELDLCGDLHLHDITYGPLIVPGPGIRGESAPIRTILDIGGGEEEEVEWFNYKQGWPRLNSTYLEESKFALKNRWLSVKQCRLFSLEKVDQRLLKCLRSPTERLSFYYTGKLHRSIQISVSEESQAAMAAVVDIASISMLMLTARVTYGKAQLSSDVLQSLGVIAQLENLNLLPYLDENVWRCVLVACEATGGDLMRRIARIIFDCLSAHSTNPNAVTFGQYMQASNATKYRSGSNDAQLGDNRATDYSKGYLDDFFYLDEAGFAWFVEKEHVLAIQLYIDDHSNLTSHSTLSYKPSDQHHNITTCSSHNILAKKSISFRRITDYFSLSKGGFGMATFLRPLHFLQTTSPVAAQSLPLHQSDDSEFSPLDTLVELEIRNECVHDAAADPNASEAQSPANSRLSLVSSYISSKEILDNYQLALPAALLISATTPLSPQNDHASGVSSSGLESIYKEFTSRTENSDRDSNSGSPIKYRSRSRSNTKLSPVTIPIISLNDDTKLMDNTSTIRKWMGNLTWSSGASNSPTKPTALSASTNSTNFTSAASFQGSQTSIASYQLNEQEKHEIVHVNSLNTSSTGSTSSWSSLFDPSAYFHHHQKVTVDSNTSIVATAVVIDGDFNPQENRDLSDFANITGPNDIMTDNTVVYAVAVDDTHNNNDNESIDEHPRTLVKHILASSLGDAELQIFNTLSDTTDASSVEQIQNDVSNTRIHIQEQNSHSELDNHTNGDTLELISSEPIEESELEVEYDVSSRIFDPPSSDPDSMLATVIAPVDVTSSCNSYDCSPAPAPAPAPALVTARHFTSRRPSSVSRRCSRKSRVGLFLRPETLQEDTIVLAGKDKDESLDIDPNEHNFSIINREPVDEMLFALAANELEEESADSAAIQSDINILRKEKILAEKMCVGIHSHTPCSCGYVLLDEEVQSAWSGNGSQKPHVAKSTPLAAMHHIKCPDCKQMFVPKLHIKCYEKTNVSTEKVESDHGSSIASVTETLQVLWSEDISYWSPFGLRLALEDMVECIGNRVVDSRWLHHHSPELYWGMIWYSSRMSTPTGLLPKEHTSSTATVLAESPYFKSVLSANKNNTISDTSTESTAAEADITINFYGSLGKNSSANLRHNAAGNIWHGAVMTGWREHTVKAKIGYLLAGEDNPHSQLKLDDIFPGLRVEDMATMNSIVSDLNGSLSGMRTAMSNMNAILAQHDTEVRCGFGVTSSRKLYISLLLLAHLRNHNKMTCPLVSDIPQGLNKGILFDKIYIDAVRCVLSNNDFHEFHCSEEEMVAGIVDEGAKAMRLGLGILM